MPTDLAQEVATRTVTDPAHAPHPPFSTERVAGALCDPEPEGRQVASVSADSYSPDLNTQSRRRIAPWPEMAVSTRLAVLRRARQLLASNASALAAAVTTSLPRTHADTLVAEVLPLLAAIKFLEKEAKAILARRDLQDKGRPFWLRGVTTIVERVPLGTVLILAPFNYPLLLPGVQAMQALAAGNCVVWKPGRAGKPVADLVARLLAQAGLPAGILRITEDTVEAAEAELALRPDKILFTGGADAGRAVLRHAAETLTPVIAELSGADAVLVLPTADPRVVCDALLFGLRLNGSQTCMAPRRLILVDTPVDHNRYPSLDRTGSGGPSFTMSGESINRPLHPTHQAILDLLQAELPSVAAGPFPPHLPALLQDATAKGATIHGGPGQPVLILNATPDMLITHADLFFPLLSVLRADSPAQAAEIHNQSRLSLTSRCLWRPARRRPAGPPPRHRHSPDQRPDCPDRRSAHPVRRPRRLRLRRHPRPRRLAGVDRRPHHGHVGATATIATLNRQPAPTSRSSPGSSSSPTPAPGANASAGLRKLSRQLAL